jgi:uncharacterized protein
MNKPRRPKTAKPAQVAKPAPLQRLADPASDRRNAMRSLIDGLPNAVSPSLAAATTYDVKPENYTTRERERAAHAMDFNGAAMNALTFVQQTGFPGFPTLSLLAQLPEYRTMYESLADACVRMWGHVKSSDSSDAGMLEQIETELKRIDLRAVVRQLVIHDQAFGGAHAYFKLKNDDNYRNTPLVMRPYTVPQGSFEGLRVVEPYWVTPNFYNSIDPTQPDFYKPSSWWMLGTEVHATRLETLVSRPVPDMLKPTYSFRGISMTQLAMQYVDNWLRTRQSVSDTVKQFSITGILTDLQQALQPGAAQDLAMRSELFNRMRDNRNLAFLDKATEEFFQLNTPLSGLDALQSQAQEQMSAVSHIPLVILLGITPSGLNASSEGEIRVWYDYVAGYQENTLTPFIQNVLRIVQLSLFGKIDESIFFDWEQLHELTALEDAERQKHEAETDLIYVDAQVMTPQQVADRLNNDLTSMYSGTLKPGSFDDAADDDIQGITEQLMQIGNESNLTPPALTPTAPVASAAPGAPLPAVDPAAIAQIQATGTSAEPQEDLQAADAAFSESDHPRANNGQFGSGGASAPAKKTAAPKLKEGHAAVATPFAVTKDPWGDYEAPGISGSLPKQHVTVKNGEVVGMHPSLAKNTGKEVKGDVQAKSEKTLAKEKETSETKAREEQQQKNSAEIAVFQMTLGKKLAALPPDKLASVEANLRTVLQDKDLTAIERVKAASKILFDAKDLPE